MSQVQAEGAPIRSSYAISQRSKHMTVVKKSASSTPIAQAELRWSYASGTSDVPLLGLTIGDMFDRTVETYPDHLALIVRQQQIRLTYRQLLEQVNRCAKGLMQLGFQKGQRIGIWASNRAEWTITQFATSKLGLILVNINPAYRVHELEYVLKQSGCSALVIADHFKSSNYTEMICTLAPELNRCDPGQLTSAKLPDLTTVIRMSEETVPGMFTWNEVMAMGAPVGDAQLRARQQDQEFDDPINIQYT